MRKNKYKLYPHHKWMMWVRKKMEGKHRKYCICFDCEKFGMISHDKRLCGISDRIYKQQEAEGFVAVVWECSKFEINPDKKKKR